MIFAKRVFLVAGIYGLVVLVPQYFFEAKMGHDYPPAITHAEFYYGFIGVAVAFQLVFLVISRDPVRYRAMMLPSIVEKASFVLAVAVLVALGRASAPIVAGALGDGVLGVLFCVSYVRTPRS